MSVANPEINQNTGSGEFNKNRKAYFTFPQALMLILVTLVVSISGWYIAGKYYFWSSLDMKRIEDQYNYLEQQVKANPKDLKHRVALGYTLFLMGENERAINELNKVLEADKNYFDAHYNIGLVYQDEGRLDDALEKFQKCIEISPKDHKGYLQKGITYRELGMYEEAVEVLDIATKLSPASADVITEIAKVAEEKGDYKIAADIYKEALGYDPMYKEAAEGLKRVQKKL